MTPSDPQHLVELMLKAGGSWETLSCECHLWSNPMELAAALENGGLGVTHGVSASGPAAAGPLVQQVKVWMDGWSRMRTEASDLLDEERTTTLIDGDRWIVLEDGRVVLSSEEAGGKPGVIPLEALVEPAGWIPFLMLETATEAIIDGRPTWRCRGSLHRRRVAGRPPLVIAGGEFSVDIDREFGFILEVEESVEGRVVRRITITELRVNPELPEALFSFAVP